MAFFTDIVLNNTTGRRELHFVNQQYDYLMGIRFDPETNTFKLDVSDEEAKRIAMYWGGQDFDVDEWLNAAGRQLS